MDVVLFSGLNRETKRKAIESWSKDFEELSVTEEGVSAFKDCLTLCAKREYPLQALQLYLEMVAKSELKRLNAIKADCRQLAGQFFSTQQFQRLLKEGDRDGCRYGLNSQ